uniref:Uncharacterized protein LOC102804509 n=1 Tax=Saccoglossus kowalevskii TaxID=10224 RepID=A0ABM0M3W8_SACKO|nr:PREDICTED: uncharacterized protein LOC102804509 [Saccoglossus kowalevskii]
MSCPDSNNRTSSVAWMNPLTGLPFGISSASEVFQKILAQHLEGLEGCCNSVDDILVYTKTKEEHNEGLLKVLDPLCKIEIRLKQTKCVVGATEVVQLPYQPLKPGDQVRVQNDKIWTPGEVVAATEQPRSYQILTPNGKVLRRNRSHIRKIPGSSEKTSSEQLPPVSIEDNIESNRNTINVQKPSPRKIAKPAIWVAFRLEPANPHAEIGRRSHIVSWVIAVRKFKETYPNITIVENQYHHSTKKTKRDKELEVKLREELDCHYKRIKYVQPIPGKRNHEVDLNKTYSVLKLVDRKQREIQRKRGKSDQWMVESEDKDIDLEKIFISSDDAETPRRILIEGEAGIGKTSLCRRLAHDWQSQKEYINDRFKFIFLLEGKKCSKSLKEELRGQGLISEAIDCDEMWEYLKNNNEDILWVIDGLDELSISNESEIVKLIKADIFRKSTVIITSRPCMEDLLDPETNYFDRKIINLGFTQETAVSLIKEHFKSKPDLFNIFDLKVLEHFSNIEDLLRNPLMCIILCFLIEEKGEMISNPDINFYQLVRMLSDCLFNRFSAQHKSELTECKDRTRMIAFRGLMQRKHMFTLKDINNIISSDLKADDVLFQTGLFMKELSVTITGDENDLYVFPHKAIQEALAAQYVYSLTDELERKEAIIGISRSRLFWPPVILVYLCVLFTDKNDTDKLKELFNIFVYHLTTHHCPSGQPVLSGSSDSTFIECLLVSNGYQYYAKSWSERFSSKKCILDLTSGTKCKHVAALDRLVKERMFANTITSVKSSSDNDRHLVSSILQQLAIIRSYHFTP